MKLEDKWLARNQLAAQAVRAGAFGGGEVCKG